MVKKQIENFDLEQICNSGQCFRMKKLAENKYRIIAVGARYLDILSKGWIKYILLLFSRIYRSMESKYFDLKRDYKVLYRVD